KSESVRNTARLSRSHTLVVSRSGLVTITGGKWTTYRKMAEDAMNKAAEVGGLPLSKCLTRELRLHGSKATALDSKPRDTRGGLPVDWPRHWSFYGADADGIADLARQKIEWDTPLHPRLPYLAAEVIWAVRNEMAWTVEDVLSRRTRALLLDAKASMEAAPRV